MRWWGVAACVVVLASVMAAQVAVPAQGQIVVSGPLVSPPFVDLGNGINPPVITNRTNVIISTPSTLEAQPAASMNAGGGTTGGVTGAVSQSAGAQQVARFDYVIAPRSGGIGIPVAGGDTRSLGEVAASMRHRGVAQPGHVYTNDDLARLSGGTAETQSTSQDNMAANQAPAEQGMSAQSAPPAQGQAGRRSPFSPPPMATGGTAQTTQNAAAGANTPSYAQPSNSGVAQPQAGQQAGQEGVAAPSADQQQKQLPRTSTVLPLVTLIGAMLAGAGTVYWKLR